MAFELEPNITLVEAVHQAIGAASTCWEHTDRAGIFNPEEAARVSDMLINWIRRNYSHGPQLGLATTKMLLDEIAVRMVLTQNSRFGRLLGDLCREAANNLDDRVLGYRTVDGG